MEQQTVDDPLFVSRTWMPTAAGIMSIVSGAMGLIAIAFLMTFAIFMTMDGIFQLILKGETRTLPHFLSTETLSVGGLNIPTGIPLVYELADDLAPVRKYYIGDPEEIEKAIHAVASQGKKKQKNG